MIRSRLSLAIILQVSEATRVNIELRHLTIADAGLTARLIRALLVELSPTADIAWPELDRMAQDVLSMHSTVGLLASADDAPARLMMLNECAAIYAGGRFAEITELYVEPEYRSQGIAAKLLQAALALGRERGWKRLEVGARNSRLGNEHWPSIGAKASSKSDRA